MRLLMLGGTEFVGRAVVESALARGWEVTVFHRGRHEPPAGVRSLLGDRTAPDGLAALVDASTAAPASGGDGWDVVVDTWSAAPRAVRDTARLLSGVAERYVYVSSCSVYAWPPPPGTTSGHRWWTARRPTRSRPTTPATSGAGNSPRSRRSAPTARSSCAAG